MREPDGAVLRRRPLAWIQATEMLPNNSGLVGGWVSRTN